MLAPLSDIRHLDGEYSINGVNTNTAESFFSLLKRGVYGTFHHVSKTHLPRYCAEFEFRWNHWDVEDGERMETALKGTKGKPLSYRQPQNGSDNNQKSSSDSQCDAGENTAIHPRRPFGFRKARS
jgi:hypothetical protein